MQLGVYYWPSMWSLLLLGARLCKDFLGFVANYPWYGKSHYKFQHCVGGLRWIKIINPEECLSSSEKQNDWIRWKIIRPIRLMWNSRLGEFRRSQNREFHGIPKKGSEKKWYTPENSHGTLKMEVWKMSILFKGVIFRFHVRFRWSKYNMDSL